MQFRSFVLFATKRQMSFLADDKKFIISTLAQLLTVARIYIHTHTCREPMLSWFTAADRFDLETRDTEQTVPVRNIIYFLLRLKSFTFTAFYKCKMYFSGSCALSRHIDNSPEDATWVRDCVRSDMCCRRLFLVIVVSCLHWKLGVQWAARTGKPWTVHSVLTYTRVTTKVLVVLILIVFN